MINGHYSRFDCDGHVCRREVFVRVGFTSLGVLGTSWYLCAVRDALQCFAASCRVAFDANFF